MNLNLTFTAPVRFSILERFALQKGNRKAHHLLSGPSLGGSCTEVRWQRGPRSGDRQHLGVAPTPFAFEDPVHAGLISLN